MPPGEPGKSVLNKAHTVRKRDVEVFVFAALVLWGGLRAQGESIFIVPQPSDIAVMEPAVGEAILRAITRAEARPDDGDAIGQLGMYFQANFLSELAAPCYRRAAILSPEEPGWHYLRGLVAEEMGETEQAEESFRAALRLQAEFPAAEFELGELLFEAGRIDEAQACYLRLTEISPTSAGGYYGLGRVAYSRKSYRFAERELTKAFARAPESTAVQHLLGMACRRVGMEDEDETLLKRARMHLEAARGADKSVLVEDVWRGRVNGHAVMASAVARRASDLIVQRRFAEAAGLYEDVVRRHPDNWGFLLELAGVRFVQGKFTAAASLCEQATRVAPEHAQVWASLAEVRRESGDLPGALAAAGRATSLSPVDVKFAYLLGRILLEAGMADQAMGAFRQVLDLDPEHAGATARLADALMRADRVEQALPVARRAVELDPGSAYARFELAVALDLSGDVEGAERELAEVLRTDPANTSARRYRDWIKERQASEGPAGATSAHERR